MKRIFLISCNFVLFINLSFSQQTSDPLKAEFITKDINNFWIAFDNLEASYKGNPFNEFYIKPGSPGISAFMKGRIMNGDSLLNMVNRNKKKYIEKRSNSLRFLDYKKQCTSSFMALKYIYPAAFFPPVYFVVGRFNSGGHSDKNGLIIGAEMNDANKAPYIVAHELIHYQQDTIKESEVNLLVACIAEGSADFLGELISGGGLNTETYKYGDAHEKELFKEFKTIMYDKENNHDWMYNYAPKNGYPADLGYWMGYKITEAYYNKSNDKRKAVSDILHIKDYKKFLKESGYEEKFK